MIWRLLGAGRIGVLSTGAWKTSNGSARRPRRSTDAARRAQPLAAFNRSGLSATAFARRHGLHYTTFAPGVSAGPKPKLRPTSCKLKSRRAPPLRNC